MRPSPLSPVLPLLALLAALSAGTAQESFLGQDADGNIHINTTTRNQSVFVNGADVAGLVTAVASLAKQNAELAGAVSSLAANLAVVRSTFERRAFLYAVGGWNTALTYLDSVERFDGVSWSSAPSLAAPRNSHAIVVMNGSLYVTGGWNGAPMDSVERFDGVSWASAPPLPSPRSNHAAAAFRGIVYVLGGFLANSTNTSPTVDSFNGTRWVAVRELISARVHHSAATLGDSLYVVGGFNGALVLDSVERFDGLRWTQAPSMRFLRRSFALVVHQGMLYAIGGRITEPLPTSERFNGTEWTTLSPSALITPRFSHGAAVYNGSIFVLGGQGPSRSVERLENTTWLEAPSLAIPRDFTCAAFF